MQFGSRCSPQAAVCLPWFDSKRVQHVLEYNGTVMCAVAGMTGNRQSSGAISCCMHTGLWAGSKAEGPHPAHNVACSMVLDEVTASAVRADALLPDMGTLSIHLHGQQQQN
jgi:hypothetical protein